MKILKSVVTFALILCCLGTGAFAQQIVLTGETCPLTVQISKGVLTSEAVDAAAEDETTETAAEKVVDVKTLNLLGIVDGAGVVVICNGDTAGTIALEDLEQALPEIDVSVLPTIENWEDMDKGSKGDRAQIVQQKLVTTGYLDGGVDGDYGKGTKQAVSNFQTDNGLVSTGITDIFTWFILNDVAGGNSETITMAYPAVYTVEDKFADICNNTDVDLEQFVGPEWKFKYDAFEGTGSLTLGSEKSSLGTVNQQGSDINNIEINVYMEFYVAKDEFGKVSFTPALVVDCIGAYRPYITSVILKNENQTVTCEKFERTGGTKGSKVTETAVFLPTEEMIDMLKNAGDAGIQLRITGVNKNYDLDITNQVSAALTYLN